MNIHPLPLFTMLMPGMECASALALAWESNANIRRAWARHICCCMCRTPAPQARFSSFKRPGAETLKEPYVLLRGGRGGNRDQPGHPQAER